MVIGRTRRTTEGREQLVLPHQPQHPVAADRQPKRVAQASPDFTVPLAAKRRAREIGFDRRQQARLRDRRRPPDAELASCSPASEPDGNSETLASRPSLRVAGLDRSAPGCAGSHHPAAPLSGKPLRATGIAWAWKPFRPVQKLGCCRLNQSASKLRDDGISKQLLKLWDVAATAVCKLNPLRSLFTADSRLGAGGDHDRPELVNIASLSFTGD